MRTTFDAEVDAAYITLVPETESGRSVRNEVVDIAGGTVVLDFDQSGMLLGLEILGATKLLDGVFLAGAERIDR
ncbi:conserved protein of unknown function [Microbacterium sp. Nx66]|uniref:DUF2283 domain-containing protein n=1 Tax=Microbacterium sp. Nx66 TaxID=2766784 RepID=UPI001656FF7D|nr:DUF2283 domain-containing protein [Microbacterium sp. Nx66]CAD5140673.1 conserved protein of unknown function [Microbacterium sp. Nx66]